MSLLSNYHTHTPLCHHASGEMEEYVKKAIKEGFDVLGFSDHCPFPYKSGFVSSTRMTCEEFDGYLNTLKELRAKYARKIDIKIGLEVEYFPEYVDYLKELRGKVDYFIFGNHFYQSDENVNNYFGNNCVDDEWLDRYYEYIEKGLNTGLYTYIAHPDLYMRHRLGFSAKAEEIAEKICALALKTDTILEYNLEGLKASRAGLECNYPCREFFKVASKYHNKVIVGIDAHLVSSISKEEVNQAKVYLRNLGLEVVDRLEI